MPPDAGSGLTDKLYWRPAPSGVWHCYKRLSHKIGMARVWISLCPRALKIKKTYGQSIDRPPVMLRCAGCDCAEIKRRGWEESGDETIDLDKIFELYK